MKKCEEIERKRDQREREKEINQVVRKTDRQTCRHFKIITIVYVCVCERERERERERVCVSECVLRENIHLYLSYQ